ncbi:UNVERIFIED_CONTAM: hypothetical protein K2H54_064487, partial [Gekko kuhli]
ELRTPRPDLVSCQEEEDDKKVFSQSAVETEIEAGPATAKADLISCLEGEDEICGVRAESFGWTPLPLLSGCGK